MNVAKRLPGLRGGNPGEGHRLEARATIPIMAISMPMPPTRFMANAFLAATAWRTWFQKPMIRGQAHASQPAKRPA